MSGHDRRASPFQGLVSLVLLLVILSVVTSIGHLVLYLLSRIP